MKLNYTVKEEDFGKDLKNIIKTKLFISNRLYIKIKKEGKILVNNNQKYSNYLVTPGDVIQVTIPLDVENDSSFLNKFKPYEIKLDILYEDEYILIVNKPSNMPVHPSSDNYEFTLSNAVASYLKKQKIYTIHIVTRLDKDTTGACIFAKNEYIQELFIRKKAIINLKKEYICIADGIFKENQGTIEAPIDRVKNSIILREVNFDTGDYAKTKYTVISRNYEKNYTILKIDLLTGRTHQIRVHMNYLGHTLLGDDLYGKFYSKKAISTYITRQALHAYKISFLHPITNEPISIVANIPDDIKRLL